MDNNIPQTYYNCKKCSRITTGYPIGCSEQDCPVKRDWWADFKWSMFVLSIFLVVVGSVFYSLVAQR